MAIYHLSASVVSRAKGQTAIATLAYIEKNREHDDRLEKTFDYSRKRDEIAFSETVLPEAAREKYKGKEPGEIWNEFEKIEKRDDAQLAQRLDMALPRELSPAQCRVLAHDWAMQQARDGYAVTLSIHDQPGNRHIDAMRSIRRWNPDKDKWGSKYHFVPELDEHGNPIKNPKAGKRGQHLFKGKDVSNIGKEDLLRQRKMWADLCNEHLARAGSPVRIDERTLEAQRDEQAALARRAEKAGDLDKMLRHDLAAADLDRDPTKHEFNVDGARRPDIVEHNVIVRDRNAARTKRIKKRVRDSYWSKRARRDRRRREHGADRVAALQAAQGQNRLSDAMRLDSADSRREPGITPDRRPAEPAAGKTTPEGLKALFSNSKPARPGEGVEYTIYASRAEAAAALGITPRELNRQAALTEVRGAESRMGTRFSSTGNRRDRLIRDLADSFSRDKEDIVIVAKPAKTAARVGVKATVKCVQMSAKAVKAVRGLVGAIPLIGKPLSGVLAVAEAPLDVASKIGDAINRQANRDRDEREQKPQRSGGRQQSQGGNQQKEQPQDRDERRGGGLPASSARAQEEHDNGLDRWELLSEAARADKEMEAFLREVF